MDKFTIVIPTMYKAPYELNRMLQVYEHIDLIDEVILIDNDHKQYIIENEFGRINLNKCLKLGIIQNDENNFVNPSWNKGVESASTDNIIIANDDILISEFHLGRLLRYLQLHLKPGVIIGPLENAFPSEVYEIDNYCTLVQGNQEITYGYGTFMIMKKESYNPVPSELKVWYGDNWQLLNKEQWYFTGVRIHTQMRTTSKTLPLRGQNAREKVFFNKKLKELKHGQYKEA